MSDKEILFIIGFVFFILQFAHNVWAKNQTQKILESSSGHTQTVLDSISSGVSSFAPHIEQTDRVFGIVKNLQSIHEARDDDGRPMVYMPREMLETQREIVNILHIVSTNHQNTLKIIEKMDTKIETGLENNREFLRNIDHQMGAQ